MDISIVSQKKINEKTGHTCRVIREISQCNGREKGQKMSPEKNRDCTQSIIDERQILPIISRIPRFFPNFRVANGTFFLSNSLLARNARYEAQKNFRCLILKHNSNLIAYFKASSHPK